MSHRKIEDWLSRMLDAKDPGPAIRVVILRGSQDTGWQFGVSRSTDLFDQSKRMIAQMQDAGWTCTYDLRALDENGRQVGQISHRTSAELVRSGDDLPSGGMNMPEAIVETIKTGLAAQKDFQALGLEAVRTANEDKQKFIALLMRENENLRNECGKLRDAARDNWELVAKVQTHEMEVQQERVKAEKIGGIVEMLANGLLARLFGGAVTSEGQALTMRLVEKALTSIATDPQKTQKIFELMDEPERLAIMEAMKSFQARPAPKEPEKVSAFAAAATAARSNANGRAS